MTFLPVVERELRVAARLRSTHWVRLTAALVALTVGGWIMLVPTLRNDPAVLGKFLFGSMSVLVNFYAVLIGVLRTVDCLSEEKREGTLGLLFLTDLKGYDIVLGKLAATSLNAFYGMLAIFPILAISLLVGGVSGGEFWRMVLVSMNNLLFSLGIGIFCSSISRDERKALMLGILLVLFFTAGLPFLGAMTNDWKHSQELNPVFLIFSPGHSVIMAFDTNSARASGTQLFYPSIVAIHGLAWLLLALSCFIVPRTWQDKPTPGGSDERRSIRQNLVFGSPWRRAALRFHLLAKNPIYWLTSRDRLKAWLVWIFLGAIGFFWIRGLVFYPREWKDEVAYCWTALSTHIVLKLWLTSEACRRFSLDRQSGALELLLSSPLTVREILHGQLLSLRRQFAGPVLIVLFSDALFLATKNDGDWTFGWIAWVVMLVADLITLSWLGMWLGLNSRSAAQAAMATIVRILFLPWLAFIVFMTVTAFWNFFRSMGRVESKLMICAWLLFGLVNNLIFGSWAAGKLKTQFRLAASSRFGKRHPRLPVADPVPKLTTAPPLGLAG